LFSSSKMWRAKHWLKHVCSAAIAAAGWGWGHAAQAAAQKPGFVEVELIAEHTAAVPGKPLWIGLSMKHDPGWHTYWKNPGDAGLPTTLSFTLPGGYRAGAIEWPYPQRIQVKQLASYGYEGTVLLPLLLFVPKDATGTVNLMAGVQRKLHSRKRRRAVEPAGAKRPAARHAGGPVCGGACGTAPPRARRERQRRAREWAAHG
jgi:hypothetical protein